MPGENRRQLLPKKDQFTGKMFVRAWIPALISSIGWSLSDIADAVVVGLHLGATGLAAIALILPIYMINCLIAHGLGSGGATQFAVLMAQGRHEEARRNATGIYLLGLIFSVGTAALGLVFLNPLLGLLGTVPEDGMVFEATKSYLRIQLMATPLFYFTNILNYYLRNDGLNRLAGFGSVAGNVFDITMNFVLVMGLKMGTGGAALATALGQILSLLIYLPGFFWKNHYLRPCAPGNRWLINSLERLKSGLAISSFYLYQMIFILLCNNILIRIGGETGVAVFDVIQNVSYLIYYLYEGTARAMQPIASTYHGEHNEPGLRYLRLLAVCFGTAAGIVVILAALLFPEGLCALFGLRGSEAEPIACDAIRIFSLGAFFGGINILSMNSFQAQEMSRLAFLTGFLRGLGILIPVTILCAQLGLKNFWWLFPITEIGTFLFIAIYIPFLKSKGKLDRNELPPERVFRRTILSNNQDVGKVSQDLEAFCEYWEATPKQSYTVMMTVEELGVAILNHGFQGKADGYIQITVLRLEDSFELHLRDNALAFNPFSLKGGDVTMSDNLDATGILMIRKRAKSFFYYRFQGFNTLTIAI